MRRVLAIIVAAVALSACGGDGDSGTTRASTATTPTTLEPPTSGREPAEDPDVDPAGRPKGTIARGLKIPWELAFLPDGSALVTERPGRVRLLSRALKLQRKPVARIRVDDSGEGGLLGLAVDPRFRSNRFVYLYRTTSSGNQVVRYRYDRSRLSGATVIVKGIKAGVVHDGGRLRFGPDNALYITTGETGDGELAQDPSSLNGKILRVRDPRGGAVKPDIVSLGHRNVQGLDWQPRTGRLFATEFGPDAHDELNEIVEGRNYGWPDAQGNEGPTPAFIDYEDVIAPSGATFVKRSGSNWSGDLLIATLRGEHLRRVSIDREGDQVSRDDALFRGRFGRLREVVEGPDGGIYVLTSNTDGRGEPRSGDDRIIRIVPPRG